MLQVAKFEGYSDICFFEQGLVIKNLNSTRDKEVAYRLRHKVFAEELGWVAEQDDCMEIDEYDREMVFFGVMDKQGEVLGYLRVALPEHKFMLDREFSVVLNGKDFQRSEQLIEITRLCVMPKARKMQVSTSGGNQFISSLLFKGIYHWCLANNIHSCCMVVEYKIFRLLRMRGFPCEQVGSPYKMPDGVMAVAASFPWRKFEQIHHERQSSFIQWFASMDLAA